MSRIDEILKTEFNFEFVEKMKRAMVNSFDKYGPMKQNYAVEKTINCIESMEKRIQMYRETGKLEYMVDVANQAMIEFTHPQHPNANYKPKENAECKMSGFGVKEIENWEVEQRWSNGKE